MGDSLPTNLHYSKTHEWLRIEKDDICVIGITDYAQKELGDLVFVELPEQDREVNAGEEVVVIESVKTASDVYSPISGKIIEVNKALEDNPGAINQSPYQEGWLFKVKLNNKADIESLLESKAYLALLSEA